MITKLLELRDRNTFIPVLCVDMNPGDPGHLTPPWADRYEARRYLLRRCGYPCDGKPNIVMTKAMANGTPATNDPYGWAGGSRTYQVAHAWIIEHWHELKDGDVVDVEFILGETAQRKLSERATAPL